MMKRFLWLFLLWGIFLQPTVGWSQTADNTSADPTLVPIPPKFDRIVNGIESHISSVDIDIETAQGSSSDVADSASNVNDSDSDLANDIKKVEQDNSGIKITETDTELKIQVLGDILFDFNKATLRSSAQQTLQKLAEFLNHRHVTTIRVEGHTDSIGTDSYNQKLSEQRAETVKNWLIDNLENEAEITTLGQAARQPVAPNKLPNGKDNPDGRQQNRRVEIFIPKKITGQP